MDQQERIQELEDLGKMLLSFADVVFLQYVDKAKKELDPAMEETYKAHAENVAKTIVEARKVLGFESNWSWSFYVTT